MRIAAYSAGCTKPGTATHALASQNIKIGLFGIQENRNVDVVIDYIRDRTASAFGSDPD